MAHPPKAGLRGLTATLTTALIAVICLLTLAPAASARVVIVPGTAQGGKTETFAVRLANERPDTRTTRLELVFPADVSIPLVKVAPVDGWTARVTMRPLDPPMTIGGRVVNEAVDSIVWEGGRVGPHEFEQFLVTAGPLPADGRLVLNATQGYEDGTADHWTDAPDPGATAPAPTIVLVPERGASPGDAPVDAQVDSAGTGDDQVEATPGATAEQPDLTLWVLLAAAALLIPVVGLVANRRRVRRAPTVGPDVGRLPVEASPERAGSR